jgi:nucleotide-binding universal stress UspA family protein
MYDRILLPTDGSEGTEEAVDQALGLASLTGATLYPLSVVDRRIYLSAGNDQQEEITETLRAEAEEAVAALAERAEAAGVEVETAVRDGIPDAVIVRYADEVDADLVVMGTHGRTGREKLANLGSVTERVVGNVDRPTLVVSIGEEE